MHSRASFSIRPAFPPNGLHWLCCAVITAYVTAHLAFYAACDRRYLVGDGINNEIHAFRSGSAADVMNALASFHPAEAITAAHFYLFGKSRFVYTLSMAPVAAAVSLAVYFLAFRLTRRESLALIAALIFVHSPIFVEYARKHSRYIHVGAVALWCLYVCLRDISLRKGSTVAGLFLLSLSGPLFHYSSLGYSALLIFLLPRDIPRRKILFLIWIMILIVCYFPHMAGNILREDVVEFAQADAGSRNFIAAALSKNFQETREIVSGLSGLVSIAGLAGMMAFTVAAGRRRASTAAPLLVPEERFFLRFLAAAFLLFLVKPPRVPVENYFASFAVILAAIPFLYQRAADLSPARFRGPAGLAATTGLLVMLSVVMIRSEDFRFADSEKPGKSEDGRGFFEDTRSIANDILSIKPVLHYLDQKRMAQNESRLKILFDSVVVVEESGKARLIADRSAGRDDDIHKTALYEPEAQSLGYAVDWRRLGLFSKEANLVDPRTVPFDGATIFLSVRNNLAEGEGPPVPDALLQTLREREPFIFENYFGRVKCLTVSRVYGNVYLYVFERRD